MDKIYENFAWKLYAVTHKKMHKTSFLKLSLSYVIIMMDLFMLLHVLMFYDGINYKGWPNKNVNDTILNNSFLSWTKW